MRRLKLTLIGAPTQPGWGAGYDQHTIPVPEDYVLDPLGDDPWFQLVDAEGHEWAIPTARIVAIVLESAPDA